MKDRKVKRGEIYCYDFGENSGSVQTGRRPVLVVQADNFNEHSPTTIIAAITSAHKCRYLPSHIFLGEAFGLTQPSVVLLEQLRTVRMLQEEHDLHVTFNLKATVQCIPVHVSLF